MAGGQLGALTAVEAVGPSRGGCVAARASSSKGKGGPTSAELQPSPMRRGGAGAMVRRSVAAGMEEGGGGGACEVEDGRGCA